MQELPAFLSERLWAQYGERANEIAAGFDGERPVTLRANTLKRSAQQIKAALQEGGFCFTQPSWYEDAFILHGVREDAVRQTALYERGEIYLQSLSSMLTPLYLGAQEGENVLDMTAAPGGKTAQISALAGGKVFLTACERDKIRFERMKFNLQRQGVPRVSALMEDATKLSEFFRFDRILLDAPCSGSGTLKRGEPMKISPKLISNCAALQKKLLEKGLSLLKSGGTLVYSTCSVLKEENEEAVDFALRRGGCRLDEIAPPKELALLPSMRGTITVAPNALYEGFFVARFVKS